MKFRTTYKTVSLPDLVLCESNDVANSPELLSELLRGDFEDQQECLFLIGFDSRMRPRWKKLVGMGTWSSINVDAPSIFRYALLGGCNKFALAHNHPSGDPTPSEQDISFTKRISRGAELLGLELVDHLIFGEKTFSLRASGLI